MAKRPKNWISFSIMAFLIFVGTNLLLSTSQSSAAKVDISFGWIELHYHGLVWRVDNFDWWHLSVVAVLSLVLTWILEKALRHRIV